MWWRGRVSESQALYHAAIQLDDVAEVAAAAKREHSVHAIHPLHSERVQQQL